jgi:ribonuclease HI
MVNNKSDWKRMRFKQNKVWLAIDKNGKPVVKNGKVLIKYQLDQDHEYWVHQTNVKTIESTEIEDNSHQRRVSGKSSAKRLETASGHEADNHAEIDNIDTICIYTDGASAGNPGPSGIGIVLRFGKHEKEISKYIGVATNNIAELEAIRTGLLQLKNTELPVRIFTDSSYAHGVLSLGWKARKNKDIVRSIKKTISNFEDIKLIKVKGHVGIDGNERADFLATSAIKKADVSGE